MEQNVDERAGREKKRKRREQKGWTRLAKSAPRRERQSVGPFVVKTWPAANCDLTQIAVKYFPFNVREIRFRNIKQWETIRNFGINLLYKKIISLDYTF